MQFEFHLSHFLVIFSVTCLQPALLASFAEKIEYKILLDGKVAKMRIEKGGEAVTDSGVQRIKGVIINDDRQ